MSKEQLLHIFDESACLTRRQMKDYVSGGMTNEESHAVEVHLNACPFCNDAIDGLFAQQEGNAAEMIATLDGDFLNDHLGRNNPRIHLNSVTAAQAHTHTHKRRQRGTVTAFWRNTSIAAMLLLAVGLLWFLKFGRDNNAANRQIAQQVETEAPQIAQAPQNPVPAQGPVNAEPTAKEAIANATPAAQAPAPNTVTFTPPSPATTAGTVQKAEGNTEEKQKKALADEVVVTQNKTQPADKYEAPAETAAPVKQIEKTSARSNGTTAATAPGTYTGDTKKEITVAKNEDVSYSLEAVSTRSVAAIAKENLAKGDDLFNRGQYEPALRAYKRELDNEDKGMRQKAIVKSAQCYSKLGNTAKAKELLQSVIDEGGPEKKTARKLLQQLEKQ